LGHRVLEVRVQEEIKVLMADKAQPVTKEQQDPKGLPVHKVR
jgi:hypothetical protein